MLTPGTRVGAFEILSSLGTGGMGEVYRARDTKLGRDVAIKLLPEAVGDDPERVARFEREAKTLAALNHPHIAQIYGFEPAGGTTALVMELVEGEDLAHLLARGAIAVDDALPIARQIAEALEAAHEQGIVHRDLKPANIRLRPDNTVKVLDFGIAKALDQRSGGTGDQPRDAADSPTIASPAVTQAGLILGTAAYMSPEQARGKPVDRRADIWAFGCVLYEMLTGRPAFTGDTVTDLLGAIVKSEPDWSRLPRELPAAVDRNLRRCLRKDTAKRLPDLGALRLDLAEVDDTASAAHLARRSTGSRTAWGIAAISVLIAAAALAVLFQRATAPPTPAPVTRFTIDLPDDQVFTRGGRHVVAVSQDGRTLAYVANQQLYVRHLNRLVTEPIPGTNEDPAEPAFSPDGRWLAYFAGGQLKKVALAGGVPLALCPAANPRGMSWSGDEIWFGQNQGLFRVAAGGGESTLVINAPAGERLSSPRRTGDWLMYTTGPESTDNLDSAAIVAQSISTGDRRILVRGGSDGHVTVTGHLVFLRGNDLYGMEIDAATMIPRGEAWRVLEGLLRGTPTRVAQLALSDSGTLVYLPGGADDTSEVVWFDKAGRQERLPLPPRNYFSLRISPDSTRVALEVGFNESSIWILNLAHGTTTRLVDRGSNPIWSPDGQSIIYRAAGGSISRHAADGRGAAEVLIAGSDQPKTPYAVTPDGRTLIFGQSRSGTSADVLAVTLDVARNVTPLVATHAPEYGAALSPDGRWLAFISEQSNRPEVYVRPFPNVDGGHWQVSDGRGIMPLWSRSGRELFYATFSDDLVEVPVITADSFTHGKARLLFRGRPRSSDRYFDIASDGRILMPVSTRFDLAKQIHVVENWFTELTSPRSDAPVP